MSCPNFCADCTQVVYRGSTRCHGCEAKRRASLAPKPICEDCGCSVYFGSKRCHRCEGEHRRKPPKVCVDCGGTVEFFRAARCRNCYWTWRGIPPWTPEELSFLTLTYRFFHASEIAQRLHRSVHSVHMKAHSLGLRRDRRTTQKTLSTYIRSNPYRDTLTSHEVAYIAGIFDGEGDLGIRAGHYWTLGITNTNKALVQWLTAKLPGSTVSWNRDREGRAPCAQVKLHGNLKIRCFLMVVLPYLIVKRAKALEALTFIEKSEEDIFDLYRRIDQSYEQTGYERESGLCGSVSPLPGALDAPNVSEHRSRKED